MTNTKLTAAQIAGLIYYGLDNNLTITAIYKLCYPDDNSGDIISTASHWKKGKKVAAIFERVRDEIKVRNEKVREGITGDDNGDILQIVDFTDKGEFIKYLNGAANRIKDDKLKNDILKMLSDHLDFKDDNKRDEANNVQRFYLPLRCQDCKLYRDAAREG